VCLEERSRSDFLKCSESGKQVFFPKDYSAYESTVSGLIVAPKNHI
jgi:hypothetical protein